MQLAVQGGAALPGMHRQLGRPRRPTEEAGRASQACSGSRGTYQAFLALPHALHG